MSKKSTTNRWAVIYNNGVTCYLCGDYTSKKEVAEYSRVVYRKEAFAVRVPSYCYHPYADTQTRETTDFEPPQPPAHPMEVFSHLRATGRGV